MIICDLIKPVAELLTEQARVRGDAPAFCDDRISVNYEQLDARSRRLAGHLTALGVQVGDRIAIYMGNRVETVEAYLAGPRAGAVATCINPNSSKNEARYMLEDSGARILLTDTEHLGLASELAAADTSQVSTLLLAGLEPDAIPASPVPTQRYDDLVENEPSTLPCDNLGLDAPAWMLYTSGTTGQPKGVVLSQRSCLWVVAACWAPIAGLCSSDRVLGTLPLFHSYALDLTVLGVVATGASERILPRFSVDAVRRALAAREVTFLPGVPTMFHYLLESAKAEPIETGDLRLCVSAGAIMPGKVNEDFESMFGIPLLDGYGITETSTMVTMNWPSGTRLPGSCGLSLPGEAIRIVDIDSDADVASGEEGELWIRGPNVMLGYHGRPQDTADALREGWYHTGDLASADENGFLTITGRIKELIIRGGENIYPAEIEATLADCEQVADCAVTGITHSSLGEVPIVFVVLREGYQFDEHLIQSHIEARLSDFKIPERAIQIDEIPRTGSGKVKRHVLRELAERSQ